MQSRQCTLFVPKDYKDFDFLVKFKTTMRIDYLFSLQEDISKIENENMSVIVPFLYMTKHISYYPCICTIFETDHYIHWVNPKLISKSQAVNKISKFNYQIKTGKVVTQTIPKEIIVEYRDKDFTLHTDQKIKGQNVALFLECLELLY